MTRERWGTLTDLMRGGEMKLTKEEVDHGYHFCKTWYYSLIGPQMPEWAVCKCVPKPGQSAYTDRNDHEIH